MYFVREIKLNHYFDTIVFSWQVKWKKPHPNIFKIALNRLKVKPEESIMVGDSITADIAGANKMGMISIWINRKNQVNNLWVKPAYIIENLTEVVEIAKKYL